MELMLLKGVLKKQEISVKHVMDLFLGILHLDRKNMTWMYKWLEQWGNRGVAVVTEATPLFQVLFYE